MPPKFLDIPHEGLERFLTPGFASNLARREELNIDVDAEGGMPIDLVGIPGLHLGDESGTWTKSTKIMRTSGSNVGL
jgi:RNA polymerase II-associated factor 1